MANNTPLGFTSAMSMGDLSFDDATSPYITKLTEAGLGFETKRLLARQANLEKLASLEGYRKGYILGADDEGAGIDRDSGLVQDDATGDVYRFRMRQANNYDAVDNADVVAKSRNKMSYQPEYVAQMSGKRVEDLTEFDFKNVKNYQTQETLARWNDPDRPSIPYDPNFVYKAPSDDQKIPVFYKSTGTGFYGRDLTDMINPKTGRSMTFDAAMNPYLNASFQLNDYLDTEANRRRIDEFNALPAQPMKDKVSQDKVNRLFIQPTNNRYPRTFNSKNLPMDEILKKYDADVPFYQQWMDQLGYNIDKAQASLHQVVGHLARILPGTNKKYWESLDKPVNEQGMTLADVLHGVDPTQFAIHQRHVAENQAVGDQAAEEWNKGNYISAGVKSLDYLRRSIIDVNYLLADSFGQMAASSGGQMIGGAIGGAIGGKAGAAIGAVTTGAMVTAFDETVQAYDDYKQKNNGETMSPARILATFGAHLVAAVPEQILQKIGLQKVLPNPIAKAIFKNEEKLVTRAAADIPEAMSKKGLWEVAKQAGSGFMKGGLAEMGQEGFQNFVSAYASQNQKNAKSMWDVATDREQIQAALSGFAMGGAMHGAASALGANKSLKAEKAMALMQEGFAKTRQTQTTAGSEANQDASTQIINTVNNTIIDKNTSVDDSLKIAKDMHEQGISLNINTDAEEAVRKKEAEAYVNAATKLHAEGVSKEKIKEVTGKSSEDILIDYALMSNYNAQDAFTHNRNRTVQSIKKMESELYKIAEDIGLTKEEAKKTLQQVAYDVRKGPNGFEVYGEKIRKGNQELLRTDLSEDERKHIEKTTDLYTLRMVNLMSNQVNKLDAFARGLEDIVLGKGNEIRISYPYSDGTLEDSGFTIKGKYIALDDPNLKKGAFGVMDDIYDSIKEMETFFNDRTNIPEDKLKASVATYNKNNKSMQLKFDEIESIKKRIDNAVVKIKDLGVKEFASTERVTKDTAKDYSKRVKDVVTAINKKKTESKTFVKQARSLVSVLSQQEDAYDKIVEGINNNKKFSESEKAEYINYLTDLRDSLKNTAKRMAEIKEEYPGVKQNAKDLLAANTADVLDKQILKEGEKDPEAYAKATRPLTIARDNVQKALNNFKAVSTGSSEDAEIIKNLADLYNDLTKRINNNRVTFNNATKGVTKSKTNESQSTNINDNTSTNAFPILTQDLLDKIFKNKTNDTINKHIRNLKKMLKDKEEKTKLYKTDKNAGNVAHMRTLRAMIELAEKWQKVVREYLAEKEKLTSKLNTKDFGLGNYAQHILDARTNEQLNNLLKKSQESLVTAEKQLKRSNQTGSKNPNAEAKIKEEKNIQKLIEARRKELQENPRVSRVDEFGVYTETGFHLLDEDKEELMKKAEELAKPYMRKNLVEIMREIFTGTKLDNGKDINAELLAYAVSSTFIEDIENNRLSDEVIKEMKEELNNVSLSLSTNEGLLSERLAEAEEMYGEHFVKDTILPAFKEAVTRLSKGKTSTSAKPTGPNALSAPKTGTISEQRKKEIAEETNEQDLYQAQLQLKQNIENYRKLKKIDSDQQQQLANMTAEFNLITKRLKELEIIRNKNKNKNKTTFTDSLGTFKVEYRPRSEFNKTLGKYTNNKLVLADDITAKDLVTEGYKIPEAFKEKLKSYGIDYDQITSKFTDADMVEFVARHERWHQRQMKRAGSPEAFDKLYNASDIDKVGFELEALIMPFVDMGKVSKDVAQKAVETMAKQQAEAKAKRQSQTQAQTTPENASGSLETNANGQDDESQGEAQQMPPTASQRPSGGSVEDAVSKAGEGYINHSGGATGSDSYWGEIGAKYEVKSNHYYVGKKSKYNAPNGNVQLTNAQYKEGVEHAKIAQKTLDRPNFENYLKYYARNWFQVKNADTVYAIINGFTKGKDGIKVVDGGTGWAVQMAIDNRKPVYVFNQQTNEWLYFDYQEGAFNDWGEAPKLTKNFAGIGTRGLKENGKKAIETVYEATFGHASNTSENALRIDQNAQDWKTSTETQEMPQKGAERPKSGSEEVPWRTDEKPASRPYANYRNAQEKPSGLEEDSEDLRRMESGETYADMAAEEALEAEEAAYAASQEQSLLEDNLGPKPKLEDFSGDVDAYIDALTAWNEKKEAQAKAEEGYSIEDMAGARSNDDEDGREEARGSMNLSEATVAEGPYNSNGDTSTPKGKAINEQKENVITVEASTTIESPRKLNKEKVDLHDKVVDIYVVDRKRIKNNKYYGYDAAWNLYLAKELINPTEARKIIKFSDKDNTVLSDYLHQFKGILPEDKTINNIIDGMSNAELLRAVIRWAERNTQHAEHSVEEQVAPMAFKLDTAAYILYKSAILSKGKNSTFKQPDINNIYEAVYAKATEEFNKNKNKKKLPTNTSRNYLRVLGDFRTAELIANSFKDLKASEYETSTLTHKDRLSAKIINTPNDRVSDVKEKPVDENGNSYLARQITISKGDCWVSAKASIYKKFLDTRRKLYEAIGLLPIDKKYATSPTEAKDINGKPTGKYRSMLDNSPHIRLLYNIEEKGGKLYFTFNETVLAVTDFSFIEFVAGSQFPKYMNPKDMDDVEVCRMWGLNPDTATNEEKIEARNLMKLQGIPKTIMANNLGRLILENLGIKPNFELGYADSWERLASGIGAFALDFGAKYGLYDFNTFEPKQGTYEWLTAKSLNLIKPNINTTRIMNDLRDQYLGTSTVGKGAHLGNGLNRFKVVDSDSNAVPIFNRAPKLDREKAVYVHNTKQDLPVSETQLDVLDKAQHQAYKFDMEVVDFMLEHENEIAARLGYIETFNNTAYNDMSFEARESALGVNSSIVRSFEALKMYAPMQKDFEDTGDFNGIFFKCFISKNGRFFINSNMLNPQIQKLHRFCCVPIKAFKTYKTEFTEKSDEWYCENFAIAQAFDKLGNREDYINFAEKMKSLNLDQLNTLRTHLITLSESQFALACERDFGIKGIGIESLPQCLSTIQHLIRRRRAMDNNQDNYESCLMVENDSTTSGYAIKLLNMPLESTTEFLEKVGVFMFLNDELQTGEIELSEEQKKQLDFTMDELKKIKGFVDIYRTSAVKVSQKIKELEADNYKALRQNFEAKIITNVKRKVKKDIIAEYHKKGEKITDDVLEELASKRATEIAEKEADFMVKLYQKLRPALPTVDENGKVDSFFRQLMKDPTMVFGYSAGMRSISSKVSGNLMEKTVNQYLDIIKQDGETAKDKVENYLVNVIGYRADKVLKQASKLKDKVESTSAQSEIQEKEKARVQALAVFDAMTHIEEHSDIKLAAKLKTNMTTEIYVKRSKDEKAYATTLNAMFNMLIGTTYGDTTGEVLEKQFRHYVCVNNLMIWMSSTMAQMYIQRKGREVSIQRNKDYRGEITYKELNAIDEKLYKEGVTPYTTLASNTARNDARMLLYKTKKVVSPISEVQDYNSDGEENKLTSTVYADIRVPDTPGRAGAVIPIHGMDGDIIMNTFLKFVDTVGINMIHDAICMSALDQIAVTKHYINSLLNTTYNYDMFNTLYSHFIRCIEAEEKNPANKGNPTIVKSRLIQKDKGNDRNIYTDEFDKHLNPNSIKGASEEHLKFVDDATRDQSEDPIPITIGMLQQVAEKWGKLIADRKAWLFSHKLFCVNMGGTKGCNSIFQGIKDGNGESGFKDEDARRNPDKKTFGSNARGFRTNGEIDLNRTEAISDPNARVGFLNDLHDMSASLNNTTCSEEHMKHLRDFVKAVKPETMIDAIVELTDNGLFNAGQFLKEASGKSVIKITLDSRDNIDNFTKVAVESHLLSPEEIYAHEIVHAALLPAFTNAGVFGYYREMTLLQNIYREASKVITWKDFMPQEGKFDPSRIGEYEAYAKETWDYIFNNPDYKTNRGLMEFCAYFTTSEKLRNILKERFTDKYNDETKATKFIDKLINLIKNIFKVLFTKEKFRDIFGRTYNVAKGLDTIKKQNLYNQFNTLINQMALANTKASNKLMEHPRKLLENMFVFLGSMINRYNRPLGQWLKKHTIELADTKGWFDLEDRLVKLDGSFLDKAKLYSTCLALYPISRRHRKAWKHLLTNILNISQQGILMSTIRDVTKPDEDSSKFELLSVKNKGLDAASKSIEANVRENLKEHFGRNLTNDEQIALTNVILRTDLQSLYDGKNIDYIVNLIKDSQFLYDEINRLDAEIGKIYTKHDDYHWIMGQCLGLARYMVTGKGNEQLNMNARNIALGRLYDKILPFTKESEELISKMASLFALQHTPETQKKALLALPKEGYENFIQVHKEFVEETMEGLKLDDTDMSKRTPIIDKIHIAKGYTKQLLDTTYETTINLADKVTQQALAKQGYSLVYVINPDEVTKHAEPLGLYRRFGIPKRRDGASAALQGYDAIGTSLTDMSYWDIETSNTGDFITNEENRKRLVEAYKKNADTISAKLLRRMKGAPMTFEEFDRFSSGFSPIASTDSKTNGISDYRITMSYANKRQALGLDERGIEVLSKMYASINKKAQSAAVNNSLLEYLYDYMDKNMDFNTHRKLNDSTQKFVEIAEGTSNEYLQKAWRVLPKEFKEAIKKRRLWVRNDWLQDLFGVANMSLNDTKWVQKIPYGWVKRFIALAEYVLKTIAYYRKEAIVLKIPSVLIGNLISNFMYSVANHMNPVKVFKLTLANGKAIREYIDTKKELNRIIFKQRLGTATNEELSRKNMLKAKLEANITHPLMEKGMYQSIVEDLDPEELESTGKMTKLLKYNKVSDKVPGGVKTAIKSLYLAKGTPIHDFMFTATQYSDFIARCVEYQLSMEKAKETYERIKKEKTTPENAEYKLMNYDEFYKKYEEKVSIRVLNAFINYDKPQSEWEQYLNDIGLLFFTKFGKRIQHVIAEQLWENPLGALAFILTQNLIIDTEDIFEQNLFNKNWTALVSNPIDNFVGAAVPMPLQYLLGTQKAF